MGKAWIAEMANRVAYHCIQLHGGYGYMEEYPICRFSRDVRVVPIFAGSTEVMKVIVGRRWGFDIYLKKSHQDLLVTIHYKRRYKKWVNKMIS